MLFNKFDQSRRYKNTYSNLRAEGAKLILSAPRASGTAPLTGVQSPWVDLSAGYDVALTNAVVNGDFASGTTGWTVDSSVLSATNNVLSVTASGVSSFGGASRGALNAVVGKKVFISAKIKVKNSSATSITLRVTGSTGGTPTNVASQVSPIIDNVYVLSGIHTITDITGLLTVGFRHNYADATTANGKVMEVQEVMCIDLTTPFTATREPSTQDIQQAMTKAGTTYWNGTKTLKFTNNAVGNGFAGTQTSGWVTDILACDTGVEHAIVNGLGALGDFEGADLSDWTDGGGGGSVTVASNQAKTGLKSIRFIQTANGGSRYKDIVAPNGNKLHVCSWYYRTSGTAIVAPVRAFDFGGTSNPIEAITALSLNSNASVWTYGSAEKISTGGGTRLYLGGSVNATVEYHLDSVMTIDKTAIFGVGNEPSTAQMDRLVQWMIARFGYINTKILKLAWRSMQRFDGSDDFESITNSTSMDLGVVAGKEQVWSVLFRASIGAPTSYLLVKNDTAITDSQYALMYNPTNKQIALYLNGVAQWWTPSNTIFDNEFYLVTFYRNKLGLIMPYISKQATPTATYANALITKPNIRVGRRETAGGHFKGDIAFLPLFEADTLDIAKILDLEWKIARDYIYTGV